MLELPFGQVFVELPKNWYRSDHADARVHGAFLCRNGDDFTLNVSEMQESPIRSESDAQQWFKDYAAVSWPSAHFTFRSWSSGEQFYLAAEFGTVFPEAILREWLVASGSRIIIISSFATSEEWGSVLEDCEKLVESVEFGNVGKG